MGIQVAELGPVNQVVGQEVQRDDDEVAVDLENLTGQQLGKSKGSGGGSSSSIIHKQLGNKDVIRSMYNIQDRILTVTEKKKRDRTLRRQKGKENSGREETVANTSLSDSNISNRKRLILREARNAWEVGKKLGFSIKGDEREVFDEIMRILSWNIRGMTPEVKLDYVRRVICKARANMCCIQESKLDLVTVDIFRKVWGDDNLEFRFSVAEQSSEVEGKWIAGEMEASLIDVMHPMGLLLDSEKSILSKLKSLVGNLVLDPVVDDRLMWIDEKDGQFLNPKYGFSDLRGRAIGSVKTWLSVCKIFHWWGFQWKPVRSFDDFFSLCCSVNLTGLHKSLWLISISTSCWPGWLARKDKVFHRTLMTLDTLLFHSKMRSLIEARAAHDVRVIMEDEAGSGGVLRDNKGVAYAMFSRPIEATGSGKAELRAIKIVLEMFMSMGWHEKVHLAIESSSSVVLEWLLDRSYRPWMLQNLFIGIDCDINLLLHAQFAIIQ
ncbi:hypothetical protein Goari_010714 [Gossypium aridum]|uniref:RNase H type-1 domain-containing protein n=1 Tax=Gossypium aridum TaxID=34290 RepID=A0A7J8Y0Z8_GOSAI|nr:hypothetical protein [Gossypium aridum]